MADALVWTSSFICRCAFSTFFRYSSSFSDAFALFFIFFSFGRSYGCLISLLLDLLWIFLFFMFFIPLSFLAHCVTNFLSSLDSNHIHFLCLMWFLVSNFFRIVLALALPFLRINECACACLLIWLSLPEVTEYNMCCKYITDNNLQFWSVKMRVADIKTNTHKLNKKLKNYAFLIRAIYLITIFNSILVCLQSFALFHISSETEQFFSKNQCNWKSVCALEANRRNVVYSLHILHEHSKCFEIHPFPSSVVPDFIFHFNSLLYCQIFYYVPIEWCICKYKRQNEWGKIICDSINSTPLTINVKTWTSVHCQIGKDSYTCTHTKEWTVNNTLQYAYHGIMVLVFDSTVICVVFIFVLIDFTDLIIIH